MDANVALVFSRCSGSLEEGRRLENLSWRLWNRETFCCDPVSEANSTTPAISITPRNSEGRYDVPSLSGSYASIADEEALEFDSDNTSSSALDIAHPYIQRQDSVNSRSRGIERHITPDDLEKMVINIKEKKHLEPITLNIQPYSPPVLVTPPPAEVASEVKLDSSSTSKSISPPSNVTPSLPISSVNATERSSTSVVRGFSPSHVSSSYRSTPLLSAPTSISTADIAAAAADAQPKKKNNMFALGGSSGDDSMSDKTNSLEQAIQPTQQQKKNPMFSFGGSSNEDDSSLPPKMQRPSALTSQLQRPATQKKQTSFQEEVATRTLDDQQYSDDVFETDEDDVDESAIDDDDDSSDWEDSAEESGNASVDDKTFFQRVDSKPNLTTRRSLITTMLHQADRANAMAAAASRSTPALHRSRTSSPSGPSLAASVESDDGSMLMMKKKNPLKSIPEIPRSAVAPQAIAQPTSNPGYHQLALSPRTTRRNMLATELTVSLRQHLLWERQQKSSTANAHLKRRHTTQDVTKLKDYPQKAHMNKENDEVLNNSWNQYFNSGVGEYHSKGW